MQMIDLWEIVLTFDILCKELKVDRSGLLCYTTLQWNILMFVYGETS